MELLIDSIRRNGLINPLVVRKKGDDRYEMISGHRRKRALEALMMNKVLPQEVKNKTKDEIEKYIIEAIKEYRKNKQ